MFVFSPFTRTDVPGTLGALVKQQGKYPFLLGRAMEELMKK